MFIFLLSVFMLLSPIKSEGAERNLGEYIIVLSQEQYGEAIGIWGTERDLFASNPNRFRKLVPEAERFEWLIAPLPQTGSSEWYKITGIGAERWAVVWAKEPPKQIGVEDLKKSGLVLPADMAYRLDQDPDFGSQVELFSQIGLTPELLSRVPVSATNTALVFLDSGMDVLHSDLAKRIDLSWTNSFVAANPFFDQEYHGTAMAGTAAVVGNKIGISGISRNTPIITLQVFKMRGVDGREQLASSEATILRALLSLHQLPHKRLVVNMSFVMYEESRLKQELIWSKIFSSLKDKALFVSASGNSGWDITKTGNAFPCNASYLENVICVGSVDRFDKMSRSSNYGWHVNLMAPGEDVLTTLPNNRYGRVSGTSIAASIVSASATLLAELAFPKEPSPVELKKSLLAGARFSPDLLLKIQYPRVLNIERSWSKLQNLLSGQPESPTPKIEVVWIGNLRTMSHDMIRGEKVGIWGKNLLSVQPYLNGKALPVEERQKDNIIFTLPKSPLLLYPAPNRNHLVLIFQDEEGFDIPESAMSVQFIPVN